MHVQYDIYGCKFFGLVCDIYVYQVQYIYICVLKKYIYICAYKLATTMSLSARRWTLPGAKCIVFPTKVKVRVSIHYNQD